MEAGNVVPADGRLFVAATMEIEEAALTGESVATLKDTAAITKPDVPLGDRVNMAFMNASVTRGRGEMIITTTGMGTEIEHISDLLNKTEADKTPLQKQLDRLTMIIAGLAGLTAIATVYLEATYEAVTIGFVAFSLLSIVMGLSARSETATAFNRDILQDRNQVFLYGLALLVTVLATEPGFLQSILGLTELSGKQWFICLVVAIALLLVDEVIKVFLRSRRSASLA